MTLRRVGIRLAVVGALAALVLGGAPTVGAAAAQPVRVLVVRATWGPQPVGDAELQNDLDVVSRFFATASFGQVALTTTVTPWLAAYADGTVCSDRHALQSEGAAAAAAYSPATFDRVVYVTPCVIGSTGAPGQPVVLGFPLSAALLAHELGHTFGMSHAGGITCGNGSCTRDPYANPWDVMGGASSAAPVGDPGALQKACAGWLTTYRDVAVPGVYTLDALERPSSELQALVVPLAGRELWIDHREAIGNDVGLATSIWHRLTEGIAVHEAPPDDVHRPFFDGAVDYLLPNDGGGSWIAGASTFRVPGVLAIDVLAHVGTTVRVRLRWLDRTKPAAPSLRPPVDGTVTWPVPHDSGTGVRLYRVQLDGAAATTTVTPSFDLSDLAAGAHVLRVTALDYAGNASRAATLRFTR